MVVIYALQRLCFGHLVAGDWAAVRSSAEEALALATSLGQHALTAAPLAWLTLLAALQGRDDYDTLLRRPGGGRRGAPAGHPDRPGPRPDPVGQGRPRGGRGRRLRRSAPPLPAAPPRVLARMAAAERIDAAVRAGEPDLARGWVDELAEFAEATRRPWALATVAYGRAMTADDSARGAETCSRTPWPTTPAPAGPRPSPHPPRLRRVAAPGPAPCRRARAPAPRPGDVRATCAPRHWPSARPPSCAPPARPPASATPRPW